MWIIKKKKIVFCHNFFYAMEDDDSLHRTVSVKQVFVKNDHQDIFIPQNYPFKWENCKFKHKFKHIRYNKEKINN